MKKQTETKEPRKGVLTAQKALFAKEWVIDRNATQAAIRAGYSEKTAHAKGSHLLSLIEVQDEIVRLEGPRLKKLEITGERTLQELAWIGFADPREAITWETDEDGKVKAKFKDSKDIPDHVAAAIQEVIVTKGGDVKLRFHPKAKALDTMARHFGLIIDRQQVDIRVQFGDLSDARLAELERGLSERQRRANLEYHASGGEAKTIEGEPAEELCAVTEAV